MRASLFLASLICACQAAPINAPPQPEGPVSSASAIVTAVAPTSKVDHAALRARLAREPLAGYAVLAYAAKIAPTQAAVVAFDASATPAAYGNYVRVLEDLGAVLRVSTDLERVDPTLNPVDKSWAIEGFIPRSALVPIVGKAVVRTHDDGTAIVVREGALVSLADARPHAAHPALAIADLADDDVRLAFDPASPPVLAEPGARLGCKTAYGSSADEDRTKVRDHATALKEYLEAKKGGRSSLGERGIDPHDVEACTLNDVKQLPRSMEITLGDRRVDTRSLSFNRCSASSGAFRTSAGTIIVEVHIPRGLLRVAAPERALHESGGCGAGELSLGGGGKTYVVEGNVPVFFEGGAKAGTHKGAPTRLPAEAEVGERVCISRMWLVDRLCVDKADLKQR